MFSLLKKIIGVLLFVFGCFDCVKSMIIGFVVMLTTSHFFTLAVVISQFMLLYTFFHCIPFRSLVFKVLEGDPWELYSESQQDQDTYYWSSSESDAVVYDPENLHWSSSSLSDYLDEVNQDDDQITRPSANKPTRHTWVWTSDEDSQDESYDDGVSGNDAGYMTETTTDSESSFDENDESVETQQHLNKSSTEMISMEIDAVSTNSTDVVGDDVLSLPGDTDDVVVQSDSSQVFDGVVFGEDVDGFQETQMTADGEDCCRDEVNIIPGSYEESTSITDGILQSKAVKLGLLAAGVGIGAYIVYKLCCKR